MWYDFGIVNPLSWIFNAISNDKSCLISMLFLSTYIDVRTVKFFPPAESWLVNSNFPCDNGMLGGRLKKKNKNNRAKLKWRIKIPAEWVALSGLQTVPSWMAAWQPLYTAILISKLTLNFSGPYRREATTSHRLHVDHVRHLIFHTRCWHHT